MGKLKNIHFYPSHLTNETRILKECNTIINNNLASDIIIIGLWKPGLKKVEHVHDRIIIKRLNCYFSKAQNFKLINGIILLLFHVRCFLAVPFIRPHVINCHTLTLLPICVLLKAVTQSSLIYDPHELETETNDSHGIRKKVSKFLERLLIHSADHIIVVSNSIRDWYVQTYKLDPLIIDVVKNIPSAIQREVTPIDLKNKLNIPQESMLFIYQGYLSKSRGVLDILNAFKRIGNEKQIVFMGYGPLEEKIKEIASTTTNIHYLPAANPDEVLRFTSGADAGIHIIPNTCLNHYYCLPNKVFEYIIAGIPFIVSDFPDIQQEFGMKDVAWFLNPGESTLYTLLESIHKDEIQLKKVNCIQARKLTRWENQEGVYIRIFEKFRKRKIHPAKTANISSK